MPSIAFLLSDVYLIPSFNLFYNLIKFFFVL
ncbi:putative membrane protein, partial [Chlamydia psittaci 06-1683]